MLEHDYTKTPTADDMNKETWITANIGVELMEELKTINRNTHGAISLNDMVVEALKDYVKHYYNGGNDTWEGSFGCHGE